MAEDIIGEGKKTVGDEVAERRLRMIMGVIEKMKHF
jgi:hypothetical protein